MAREVDGAFRVYRQFLLDQVGAEVLADQEPPVPGRPDRLDIVASKPRHLERVRDRALGALDHLGRRVPTGADDLVILHHDRLRGARTRVDAHRDPGLLLAGKERSPPGDGGQGLHPGEEGPRSRPFGERVTHHRQP